MHPPFEFKWETAVAEIGKSTWDACFAAADVRNSYHLAEAIEHSDLPNVAIQYLVASHAGIVVAILPCYLQNVALDILASSWIHSCCRLARKVYRPFLNIRVFFVGSPIAICKGSLGLSQIEEQTRGEALSSFVSVAKVRGAELNAHMLVIREIELEQLNEVKTALAPEVLFVPSLPAGIIPLNCGDGKKYIDRLRRHYRSIYRQRKRLFESGKVSWELCENYGAVAPEMYLLYSQLQTKLRTVQVLSSKFFAELSNQRQKDSFVLLARKDGVPVAFALVFVCARGLFPAYIGFDYSVRDQFALYYNTLYRVLEESEERGFPEVLLGQTAYESKALIGASFAPLYLGLLPLGRFTDTLVRRFSSLLFPETSAKTHRVFKSPRNN